MSLKHRLPELEASIDEIDEEIQNELEAWND